MVAPGLTVMLGEVSAPGIQRKVALVALVLAVSVVEFPAQIVFVLVLIEMVGD